MSKHHRIQMDSTTTNQSREQGDGQELNWVTGLFWWWFMCSLFQEMAVHCKTFHRIGKRLYWIGWIDSWHPMCLPVQILWCLGSTVTTPAAVPTQSLADWLWHLWIASELTANKSLTKGTKGARRGESGQRNQKRDLFKLNWQELHLSPSSACWNTMPFNENRALWANCLIDNERDFVEDLIHPWFCRRKIEEKPQTIYICADKTVDFKRHRSTHSFSAHTSAPTAREHGGYGQRRPHWPSLCINQTLSW